jgi:hypothetical protein
MRAFGLFYRKVFYLLNPLRSSAISFRQSEECWNAKRFKEQIDLEIK